MFPSDITNRTVYFDKKMDPYYDQMMGKLALSYKMITSDQYVEALTIQNKESTTGFPVYLSDVFLRHGHLRSDQIDILRKAIGIITSRRKKKRFGPLAVSRSLITDKDLVKALDIQKQMQAENIKPIGQILVDMGCMNGDQVNEILELQKNMPVSIPKLEEVIPSFKEQGAAGNLNSDSILLNISQDSMIAVVELTEKKESISVDTILGFLKKKGVSFGFMPVEYMKDCLANRDLGISAFIVARGQKGMPPVSGPFKPVFPSRPLEHSTDFTPAFVKKGDVLATRVIDKPGSPKITVFGTKSQEKDHGENRFINGPGARLNETGDTITASRDGEPFLFADGAVGVLEKHIVKDPKGQVVTLSVEGDVVIEGIPGPGSLIRCVHLCAMGLEETIVIAEGDVKVNGLISDSNISSMGLLTADFIRNSNISCLGDVVVENDVLDSNIETASMFITGQSIVSSFVRAKRGMEINNVVSSDDINCTLEIGSDVVPSLASSDRAYLEKLEIEINNAMEDVHSVESMYQISEQVIADMENNREKKESELLLLKEMKARIEKKSKKPVISGQEKIQALSDEINADDKTVSTLLKEKTELVTKLETIRKQLNLKMKTYRELKENLEIKNSRLSLRLKSISPVAMARIRNEIDAGTVLRGPYSKKILENTLGRVLIREVENTDGIRLIQITAED